MSKATHRARLVNQIKYFSERTDGAYWSREGILFILENQDKDIKLRRDEHGVYWTEDERKSFKENVLTDIKEIKPEIKLPETPFFIQQQSRETTYKVVGKEGILLITWEEHGVNKSYPYSEVCIYERITCGAWLIVPEPKKEMRPYTDDEWKEWFLNDGVCIVKDNPKHMCRFNFNFDDAESFVDVGGEVYYNKDQFLDWYTDHHGNKFEKEVTK